MEQAAAAENVKPWQEESQRQAEVMAVESKPRKFRNDGKYGNKRPAQWKGEQTSNKMRKCGACGRREHLQGEVCPAVDKRCLCCGAIGHFANSCIKRVKTSAGQKAKQEISECDREEAKVRGGS